MARKIPQSSWDEYEAGLRRGLSKTESAKAAGIDYSTVYRRFHPEKKIVTVDGQKRYIRPAAAQQKPRPYEKLSEEAKRAWNDFGYFQRRYFGRIATPWQEEAAERVLSWLASPEKEYVVINAPPGSGKSTTFTLDIPAWVTVRNRAIRGQIGSNVESSASKYVLRLRRAFERKTPIKGEAEQVSRGLALDAESTLAADFGAFRPTDRDLWSATAFVVAQHDNVAIDEKEPTWSAFGFDSGYLGMRYDFVVWDDLVDKKSLRTENAREKLEEDWDDIAEKRLDPGGLLILQGQRLGAEDLYRYALDKQEYVEDEDDGELRGGRPKYQHIVFKAHYLDRCVGNHRPDSPPYPEGCLLDPRRLKWRELSAEMANKRNNFAVIYQQEDIDPEDVLVNPLWVTGGTDPKTGEHYPGCLDKERGLCELPKGLAGQILSFATADPSPTQFWAVQWWAVPLIGGQPQDRYLLDMVRQKMDAPDFLDWNNATQQFTGIMQEWQQRSHDLQMPITTWVVEANAAQRFMLQYEHCRRWLSQWRVQMIPHQTQRNKSDPELGVQMLKNLYRFGQVRLPYKHPAYRVTDALVQEVTHYPDYRTDDTVMAQWFGEWTLPLLVPPEKTLPRFKRPSWLGGSNTYERARLLHGQAS